MLANEAVEYRKDSMLKKALLTILLCALALVVLLSRSSSNQAERERKKQAAIEELDRKNAEEAPAMARRVATDADRAKQAERDLDADKAIANLGSSDRDVLNEAIQKIQYYRACKAVPQLMHLLEESPDDYIAGISAQTIAVCYQRSTFETIIDEFLRRNATPSMIDAIGKINTTDQRVIEKVKKLIAKPNQDEYVLRSALRLKSQLEISLNKPI
jgi:hypothetical protein